MLQPTVRSVKKPSTLSTTVGLPFIRIHVTWHSPLGGGYWGKKGKKGVRA